MHSNVSPKMELDLVIHSTGKHSRFYQICEMLYLQIINRTNTIFDCSKCFSVWFEEDGVEHQIGFHVY